MSDVLFYEYEEMDKKEVISKSKSNNKKISVLKTIIICLGILLFFEVLVYAFVMPCFGNPKFEYIGLDASSSNEVSEVLTEMRGQSWFSFDKNKAASVIKNSLSFVDEVTIVKKFPSTVYFKFEERQPVAKTLINIDSHTVPIQIDKNGVLFTSTKKSVSFDSMIPLISGLPLEILKEGGILPVKYRSLIGRISALKALPQKYFASISEIQVVSKQQGNYELVLYPVHSKIKVLTDRTLDEAALKYMMVALDVVNSIEPNVSEVDLRYGSVSYRTK